ncbi:MAG: hypothetical protein EHM36_11980, partial [Deltaproteobacteria bacterium]
MVKSALPLEKVLEDPMMTSEPHKIKTVRRIRFTFPEDRRRELIRAGGNTFRIPSQWVTFDMTGQGTSAVSQDQWSGILIGDEAYAGSRSFERLEESVRKVLGHKNICPTHNLRGSIKLISTTLVQRGDLILSNSLTPRDLTEERSASVRRLPCDSGPFNGDPGINPFREELNLHRNIPYVFIEAFADGYRPISLSRMKEIRKALEAHGTKLVLNASRVVENGLFIRQHDPAWRNKTLAEIVNEMVRTAHICILDAGQDPRCNTGGLISTDDPDLHLQFQNEVVVYEGLHTYGGMAGRTMEIFARGIEEMVYEGQALWIETQAKRLASNLEGIPLIPGCDGVYIKADEFLPRIKEHQAQALAAALYLKSGVRAFLEGRFLSESLLPVQIPRLAMSNFQLDQVAGSILSLFEERECVRRFRLIHVTDWQDEALFEWDVEGLKDSPFTCEPHTIHTIEYVGTTTREKRGRLIQEAGYNPFLLPSRDVTLDLLTDSGTAAMSVEQWQAYEGAVETPAT